MKKLVLLMMSFAISLSVSAGEVTGAGMIVQTLQMNNINVGLLQQQGMKVIAKRPKVERRLQLGKVKYYVSDRQVYNAGSVNRVEFKPGQSNKFMWSNVESMEINNQMVYPSQIKGFVIQK